LLKSIGILQSNQLRKAARVTSSISASKRIKQRMGTPLTPLDFKFHFFPWHKCPDYAIDPTGVVIGFANTSTR
jgi:hypothetical protein